MSRFFTKLNTNLTQRKHRKILWIQQPLLFHTKLREAAEESGTLLEVEGGPKCEESRCGDGDRLDCKLGQLFRQSSFPADVCCCRYLPLCSGVSPLLDTAECDETS